jgi:type IV secretion system protein VirB5
MRRLRGLLLCLTILTAAETMPAGAQMSVIDNSNLVQTTLAAQRALSELQQLTAQYNQLVATYQMLTNPTDVVSMVSGLSVPSLQNPLPNTTLLNGLIGGQTAASGAGVQFYNQSHVYTPTDGGVASTQLIANANSIANLQGVATTNLQSIQQRLALLPGLEAALAAATSITQVNAINGRIAVEANYVQAQQAQAQNLSVLASQQEASARQQAQEEHAREANAIAAQYRAGAQ